MCNDPFVNRSLWETAVSAYPCRLRVSMCGSGCQAQHVFTQRVDNLAEFTVNLGLKCGKETPIQERPFVLIRRMNRLAEGPPLLHSSEVGAEYNMDATSQLHTWLWRGDCSGFGKSYMCVWQAA